MASSATSLYSPLNPDNFEIRLASVEKAPDGTISCQLETVSLRDGPLYAALSYVWGDQTLTETILLDGQEVSVTVNLASALQSLKNWLEIVGKERGSPPFRIWIDAICINQNDPEEKGRQIQLMGYIYFHAKPVFAWMEIDEETLSFAIVSLKKISMAFEDLFPLDRRVVPDNIPKSQLRERLGELHELFNRDRPGSEPMYVGKIILDSWRHLMNAAYWSRAWIVQESVLSTNTVFCCFKHIISFIDLARAAQIMMTIYDYGKHPRPHCIEEKEWEAICENTMAWNHVGTLFYLHFTCYPYSKKAFSQLPPKQLDFNPTRVRFLMGSIMPLEATDPKDRVYALSSLSGLGVTPSYSDETPACKPFVDYARSWAAKISADQELGDDEICRLAFLQEAGTGCLNYDDSMPTWTPNLPQLQTGKFVQRPNRWCAVRDALKCVDHDIQITDTLLTTHGVEVQAITYISEFPRYDYQQNAPAFFSFFRYFVEKWPRYVTNIPPLQAFMRVLTGDFTSPSHDEPLEYALEFIVFMRFCFEMTMLDKEVDPSVLHSRRARKGLIMMFALALGVSEEQVVGRLFESLLGEAELAGTSKTRKTVMKSIGRAISAPAHQDIKNFHAIRKKTERLAPRSAMFETEQGYLGLCPRNSAPGDIVCLLCGSKLPILLRKKDNHYIHVGVCTILGFLNDEVSVLIDEGKLSIQKFVIH